MRRYVERPLLPLGRKMDIRQWVVVTDWAPLTVWFYRDCYIRFAAEDYELEDLDNLYMHLTNNSVAKHCETFEEGSIGDMNMWHSKQMDKYLQVRARGATAPAFPVGVQGFRVWGSPDFPRRLKSHPPESVARLNASG